MVPGDSAVAHCQVHTCAHLRGMSPCGVRPGAQPGGHPRARPAGLTSPGRTAEGLSHWDSNEPQHGSWTSAPDSQTPFQMARQDRGGLP